MGLVKNKGFTLIEAMVGVALFLIIFTSVFGAYRLAMMASSLSSCRVAAIAIGNSQIEKIRNLPYGEVGTKDAQLPRAAGKLDQTATEEINGIIFTILTEVRFIADETDGVGVADSCDLDYKQADVEVSWGGATPGKTFFSTKVAPESKVQEAQSCQSQPGGVLTVTVFDDGGSLVPSPEIKIVDLSTGIQTASATPETGRHSFPLSPQSYRVEVSKTDYSAARTYGSDEVAVPESPHPTVLQDSETPMSLSIDRTASISVEAIAPVGQGNFSDNFDDESLLAETSNVAIAAGNATLVGPPYSNGYAISQSIAPGDLAAWNEIQFSDQRPPGTEIRYQLLYYDGVDWMLIPDADLGQNSAGLTVSPINLMGLDKGIYPVIRIKAQLSTSDPEATPEILNWQAFWSNSAGTPVSDAVIHLQGSKIIGEDESGEKVYKYSQEHNLGGAGRADISGIDGDSYYFSVVPGQGLALIGSDPPTMPVQAPSGGAAAVKLYLQAPNGLLISVFDAVTLAPVFSATVKVKNETLGYEKTQITDSGGETYFTFLQDGEYEISVSALGYQEFIQSKTIAGDTSEAISIVQNE